MSMKQNTAIKFCRYCSVNGVGCVLHHRRRANTPTRRTRRLPQPSKRNSLATETALLHAILVSALWGVSKENYRYQAFHVIYRQGAYEARYDAVLVMGQSGDQTLQALYARMIAEAERSKLAARQPGSSMKAGSDNRPNR